MEPGYIWKGSQDASFLIRKSILFGRWEEVMVGRCDNAYAEFTVPKAIKELRKSIVGYKFYKAGN